MCQHLDKKDSHYNTINKEWSTQDFVVNNDYQIDNKFNPHKSFGYLRTPEFSEVLQKFSKEENIVKKVLSRFYSIFQK